MINAYENNFPISLKYVRTHTPYKGKREMSLRDLSELTGVSPTYLSQLENNTRKPSRELISRISKGLSSLTKLSEVVYFDFFTQMTGEAKPSAKTGLKVSNTLIDTKFVDFLQLVMGYSGTLNIDETDNDKLASIADKDWAEQALHDAKSLQAQYINSVLTNIYEKDNLSIDGKKLSKNEKIILQGAVDTIKKLRKNNK